MYVISVKCKYNFEKDYDWRYASIDQYNSFSTGYPCWDSYEGHAELFNTIEEAEQWFNRNSKFLLSKNCVIVQETLAIRKKIYKTIKELSLV